MPTNSGTDQLRASVGNALEQLRSNAKGALVDEATTLLASVKSATPEDSGALRDSEQVDTSELDDLIIRVTAGDSQTAPYAIAIHEHPGNYDPPSWRGTTVKFSTGGPKYLEGPFLAAKSGILERLAAKVKPS